MNFKNSKCTRISSASQPAIRPGSTSAMALEFLHYKGNRIGFTKLLFQRTFGQGVRSDPTKVETIQ